MDKKELPRVKIFGKEWFIDEQLRQYCNVKIPHERLSFSEVEYKVREEAEEIKAKQGRLNLEFLLREIESVLESHRGLRKYLSDLEALERDLVERMEKVTENLKK